MQDSKIPVTQEYKLGKYKFIFSKDIKFTIFICETYTSITFFIDEPGYIGDKFSKYEVIDNCYLGYRLLTSTSKGWNDVPFYEDSLWLMHPSIKVIEEE